MTDKTKEALKLALDWIEGNGKYDAAKRIAQTIREALAEESSGTEQTAQTATYTCGVCGVSMQMEQPAQQEPVSLAGQGYELHKQLLEAGRELLRSANEPEKWGSVGPGPTEIAWDKFSSLASHVCTGIDSPPAQRTWVGLTDEEMQALWYRFGYMELMRAVEAKLKEKNA